jgi:hypothetical protein
MLSNSRAEPSKIDKKQIERMSNGIEESEILSPGDTWSGRYIRVNGVGKFCKDFRITSKRHPIYSNLVLFKYNQVCILLTTI